MNIDEVKEKLDSIKKHSQYIRVSATHPLELFLGINEKGFPTLRYNGDFSPVKIIGTNFLEVKQIKTSLGNSILFSYVSDENVPIFYHFCVDMINMTEHFENSDGYAEIVNRYYQWKKTFTSNNKLLTESEILGLIGELIFLKENCFPKYGTTESLKSWSGPESTHKDFSYKKEWFEIKSIHNGKLSVSISSAEQLDSDLDGHLVVYTFDKMSPSFSGLSLNKLVNEIISVLEFDTDKDMFYFKLKAAGYSYNEEYDNYNYKLVSETSYLVNDDFPRIKLNTLPKGICKIQYDILLQMIEKNKEQR